jgi:hypothetical protein
MSTKRKRAARASEADAPKQLVREHARCLRTERRAVETLIRAAWASPIAGSVMLGDREAASAAGSPKRYGARADVLDRTARLCNLLVASSLNHILALEECLSAATVPLYAPMTLARSVLDAAVQFCYLTDCDLDASTRLVRGAAVLLESARQEVTAVRHMRQSVVPGVLGIVAQAEEELEAQINSAGIDIRKSAKGRVTLSWPEGRQVNLGVSVTAEQEKYIPGVESSYRVGSGASHAMEWMIHDPSDEPARVYMACGAADLALAALLALADRAGRYTGHDASSVCGRITGHRRTLVGRSMALSNSGFNSVGRFADKARLDHPPD